MQEGTIEEAGRGAVIATERNRFNEILGIADQAERALKLQEILSARVGQLESLIEKRREIDDAGRTKSFWRVLLLAAKAEEEKHLGWLNAHSETKNDEILPLLVELNFGLFGLAERRFGPPLRHKGEQADPNQLDRINYLFRYNGFSPLSSKDSARLGKMPVWKSPLREGEKADAAKDAYMASLYRRLVTALVPEYLEVSFEYLPEKIAKATGQEARITTIDKPEKTTHIQEKVLPLLDRFIRSGRDVFDAFDVPSGGFQRILNGYNAEVLAFLYLRNLGFETIHPTIPADLAGIDFEAKLPQNSKLPPSLRQALGFRSGHKGNDFVTFQVKSGPAGEYALIEAATAGIHPGLYDITLVPHKRVKPKTFKVKTEKGHKTVVVKGETHRLFTLPSLSQIQPHRRTGNPGEFNAFVTKENPHPGIPTPPMLEAFVEAATDEHIFGELVSKEPSNT